MTEAEMELALLRYNMLSKEKAVAIHMYEHAGKSSYYDDEWTDCIAEMTEIKKELRKHGYKPVYDDYKIEGKLCYSVYKIVPTHSC